MGRKFRIMLSALPALAAGPLAHAAVAPANFQAEKIEPGKTQASQLHALLGKPYRRVQDSAHHDFYFYDLGEGSTMDATVSVRNGVVEYVSYLCNESMREVKSRYAGEPSIQRNVESGAAGLSSTLGQVLYEGRGRGYIYEPRSQRIKACVAWVPGKKFDELGR